MRSTIPNIVAMSGGALSCGLELAFAAGVRIVALTVQPKPVWESLLVPVHVYATEIGGTELY